MANFLPILLVAGANHLNNSFANWYSIAQLNSNHELLQRRRAAVDALIKTLDPELIYELVRIFFNLPAKNAKATKQFEDAICEADNAFTTIGSEIELTVLAGATLALSLESTSTLRTTAAICLVVPHLQEIRNPIIPEIIQRALQFLANEAASLRNTQPTKTKVLELPKDSFDAVITALNADTVASASEPLTKLFAAHSQQIRTLNSNIITLQSRYDLLREESDMLWWLTGESSRIKSKSFSDLPQTQTSILVGLELAQLTRKKPGPVAVEAFIRRMFKQTQASPAKPVQLDKAVNALERETRKAMVEKFENHSALDLCPVYFACSSSLHVEGDKEWFAIFKNSQDLDPHLKLNQVNFAKQVYLESLLLM
jgi:hypothetical protein